MLLAFTVMPFSGCRRWIASIPREAPRSKLRIRLWQISATRVIASLAISQFCARTSDLDDMHCPSQTATCKVNRPTLPDQLSA